MNLYLYLYLDDLYGRDIFNHHHNAQLELMQNAFASDPKKSVLILSTCSMQQEQLQQP